MEDTTIGNRNPKWEKKYAGMRLVMWDMTNVLAYSFTDADLQQISTVSITERTVSREAFSHNFVGGNEWQISGQEQREGYLERQEEFQQIDLVDNEVLPFLNIYDKATEQDGCVEERQTEGSPISSDSFTFYT
ncbi:hypothetical protein ACHAXR_008915 [Thalassiosira sp. AJA248-18]